MIFSLFSSMSVLNSVYTFFWSSKNFSFQICELCFFNFLFLLADSFFNFALFFSMVFVKDLTLIGPHSSYIFFRLRLLFLQSVSWILAEFYFNRGLQRLYTGTCIILQKKTINGFLCLLIVFLKSKTYQLILKDVIKLNRNLR